MNPERCHCPKCSSTGDSEIDRLRKAVAAAIDVAYDPGKQPALVLTLIDLGFIMIRDGKRLPILEE